MRVIEGDEEAWKEFVGKFYGFLFSLAYRFSRADEDLAEELCVFVLENLKRPGTDGATFARLRHFLSSIERFGGRSKFTTWLALVAKNLFRDWFRSRVGRAKKKKPDHADDATAEDKRRWPLEYAPARCRLDQDRVIDEASRFRPDRMLELRLDLQTAQALGEALRSAVDILPEKTRQVFLLRWSRGLPGNLISRIMGFSTRQRVYDELARSRRLLRTELEKRGFSAEKVNAAIEHLPDVFSENLLPDPPAESVMNCQKLSAGFPSPAEETPGRRPK